MVVREVISYTMHQLGLKELLPNIQHERTFLTCSQRTSTFFKYTVCSLSEYFHFKSSHLFHCILKNNITGFTPSTGYIEIVQDLCTLSRIM